MIRPCNFLRIVNLYELVVAHSYFSYQIPFDKYFYWHFKFYESTWNRGGERDNSSSAANIDLLTSKLLVLQENTRNVLFHNIRDIIQVPWNKNATFWSLFPILVVIPNLNYIITSICIAENPRLPPKGRTVTLFNTSFLHCFSFISWGLLLTPLSSYISCSSTFSSRVITNGKWLSTARGLYLTPNANLSCLK